MHHSASFNCLEHMLKLLHEPLKAFISSVIGHFKGANQRFNCLTGHSTRPVAHCPFQGKKELPVWTNSKHIKRTAQLSRGLSAPMVFALKGSMLIFFSYKICILSCQCVVLTSIMMHLFHATRVRWWQKWGNINQWQSITHKSLKRGSRTAIWDI